MVQSILVSHIKTGRNYYALHLPKPKPGDGKKTLHHLKQDPGNGKKKLLHMKELVSNIQIHFEQ
jgi:hypothetical protein